MSYCVNCGVELAESERSCPLCATEVVNPRKPWQEPKHHPYPVYFETVIRGVDRRYFSSLATVVLLIPMALCLLIDYFASPGISWSSYVVGASVLLAIMVLLPVASGKRHSFLFLGVDVLAILAYLWWIDYATGGLRWFLPVGLPITLTTGALAAALLWYFRYRKQKGLLPALACLLLAVGVLCLVIELVVLAHLGQGLLLQWSWYVLIPCVFLAAAMLLLNKRNRWKENIRKRLFF